MSPYIKYIRKKYIIMMGYLPFQVFLLFPRPEDEKIEKQVYGYFQTLLSDSHWLQSKFGKQLFRKSVEYLPNFRKEYFERKRSSDFVLAQKTFLLIEQFLPVSEMKQALDDFVRFVGKIDDYFKKAGVKPELDKDEPTAPEMMSEFIQKLPSKTKPLTAYLTELPFQIFTLVADSDRTIDFQERAQYLTMLKENEWCESECARDCFVAADYAFDELFKLYTRGKFKKDLQHVKRTINIAENLYTESEMLKLKSDILKFARNIAKASGGIQGFASVSREEKNILKKLESIVGDLSEQRKNMKRKEDNTNDVLFSDVKSNAPSSSNKRASVSLESRENTRISTPNINAVAEGQGKRLDIKVLNISKHSILCDVDFKGAYVDLYFQATLSIMVAVGSDVHNIAGIRCKTVRSETLFWTLEHIPNKIRIAWRFIELTPDQESALNRLIDDMKGREGLPMEV